MSTFSLVDDAISKLGTAFSLIEQRDHAAGDQLHKIATAIQQLCRADEDGALAAMHLFNRAASTRELPVYYAILCEIIGRELQYATSRRHLLICAALTANYSYMDFQDRLNRQSEPLTEMQREKIYRHPRESRVALEEAGIHDELWLKLVEQHHEREDGSGYPDGVSRDRLDPAAALILVSETYCAGITCRGYRQKKFESSSQHATSVMLGLYKQTQNGSSDLMQRFIKTIGVYPPGSWVKLADGETAIVTNRQSNSSTPLVRSFMSRHEEPFSTPMLRDTSDPDYRIAGIAAPPERRARIHMSSLWA